MAQWSTLPCCSCLFSTAHPYIEIASLQQFALSQHSGRACRCSSCTGKHWENEVVPDLQKNTAVQMSVKNLHNVFVKLCIKAVCVEHPVWNTLVYIRCPFTCVFMAQLRHRNKPWGCRLCTKGCRVKKCCTHVFPDLCHSLLVCCCVRGHLHRFSLVRELVSCFQHFSKVFFISNAPV